MKLCSSFQVQQATALQPNNSVHLSRRPDNFKVIDPIFVFCLPFFFLSYKTACLSKRNQEVICNITWKLKTAEVLFGIKLKLSTSSHIGLLSTSCSTRYLWGASLSHLRGSSSQKHCVLHQALAIAVQCHTWTYRSIPRCLWNMSLSSHWDCSNLLTSKTSGFSIH